MKLNFHFKGRKLAKWSLTALGAVWMLGATWFAFIQPDPMAQMLSEAKKKELAQCRRLPTSDARYQCTSKIMLAKDNRIFNQTLIILLPPLGLLIGYWGVARLVATRSDRKKSQTAHDYSQQRMAEWRSHLNKMRADLETQQKKAAIAAQRASETLPHRARRR